MYFFYSLLFTLGIVLTAPYYLWRQRHSLFSAAEWRERFGLLPHSFQQAERDAIWVHAVSVGETIAAAGLVRELQRRHPERKVFLSHVTAAGREAGASRLPDLAGRFLLPLDLAFCMRRAFRTLRPALLVIVETELWPNMLRAARESGARILVVNGRISDRSFPRYKWISFFMRRVLGNVHQICAQSAVDAERFVTIGAAPDRVTAIGNLKFDAQPPALGEFAARLEGALVSAARRPILVAGSTMPGEEDRILQAWREVQPEHSSGLLILAPRHPARFESVAALLAARGVKAVRRTQLASTDAGLATQLESSEVLLLDTIGELAGVFGLADVVFIGGSLVPTGGHNVLEPAYWSKPILFGPHMHNFRDIAHWLISQGAAVQVAGASDLAAQLSVLFRDADRRARLGQAARRVLDSQRGATERALAVIESQLCPAPAAGVS
jgi:3-deoxy-D-manno-octulosonic-acid transferase